jgi:hypothetical protein
MEVLMPSDIRVFLATLAVSVISWAILVAVLVPLCLPLVSEECNEALLPGPR